jgi:hypothetical protein
MLSFPKKTKFVQVRHYVKVTEAGLSDAFEAFYVWAWRADAFSTSDETCVEGWVRPTILRKWAGKFVQNRVYKHIDPQVQCRARAGKWSERAGLINSALCPVVVCTAGLQGGFGEGSGVSGLVGLCCVRCRGCVRVFTSYMLCSLPMCRSVPAPAAEATVSRVPPTNAPSSPRHRRHQQHQQQQRLTRTLMRRTLMTTHPSWSFGEESETTTRREGEGGEGKNAVCDSSEW